MSAFVNDYKLLLRVVCKRFARGATDSLQHAVVPPCHARSASLFVSDALCARVSMQRTRFHARARRSRAAKSIRPCCHAMGIPDLFRSVCRVI